MAELPPDAGPRASRESADPHIHLRRLDAEGRGDRARKHAAAARADVLHAGGHEQPPRLDTHLDLAARLVQVEPVRRRPRRPRAGSAPARDPRRRPLAPERERLDPSVEPLALRIGIPAPPQRDRILAEPVRRLVDRLLERPARHRRARPPEGHARRHVVDHVVVLQVLGGGRIDHPAEDRDRPSRRSRRRSRRRAPGGREGRPSRSASSASSISALGRWPATLISSRAVERDPHGRAGGARELDRRDRLGRQVLLCAEASAHVFGDQVHLLVGQAEALGDLLRDQARRLRRDVQRAAPRPPSGPRTRAARRPCGPAPRCASAPPRAAGRRAPAPPRSVDAPGGAGCEKAPVGPRTFPCQRAGASGSLPELGGLLRSPR